MLFLIALMVFSCTTLAVWLAFRPKESPVTRRLGLAAVLAGPLSGQSRRGPVFVTPLAAKAGMLFARFMPKNAVRLIERMLAMAGDPVRLPVFLGVWGGLMLLGPVMVAYFKLIKPDIT